MKHFLLKTWLTMLCLLVGVGTSWAEDVINNASTSSKLGNTATNSWVNAFDLTLSSGAVVNVRSMGTKSTSNALQWNANGYLYMSKSGGKLKSVTIKGASKTVNVYASNTAYSAAPSETVLGTISVTSTGATYDFTSDYTYLALKGTASSTSITEITIEYQSGGSTPSTPYTVTFNPGTDGTCSTTFLKEESAGAGVTLPSCTANTNYTFVGWSTSSTPTSANAGAAGETYKPSSNCTLYAYYTYQAPSHNAKFFVNGEQYGETQSVAEGSAITFPADNPSIDDVVFIGWAEAEISGTQDNAPDLVASKNMGSADANFYAVFATADSQLGEPENKNLSFSLGSTMPTGWTKTASNAATGYLRLKTGEYAQADLEVAGIIPAGKILCSDNMDVVVSVGTYGSWTGTTKSVKITIDLLDANENVLATNYKTFSSLTSSESAEKPAISVTKPSDPTLIKYLRVTASDHNGGNEIRLKYVKPTYEICDNVSFTDYCTTVSPKTTATLNIADADKNVALGYNGTKDVTISVNEAEYDGTLTVASSNEEVATVTYEGTTATITYVGEGEAYISVTAPSTANYYAIKAPQAIKVTATDSRQAATVSIDPATISVDNGASAEYTVTTAYDGTISVASDKPSVATVSYNEGIVTVEGKSVGTATLTISGEGNATYKPFSQNFTITVNKVVPVGIKNLRDLLTSSTATNYEVRLENAIVTCVGQSGTSTPTIYVEDDNAGVVVYAKSTNLEVGDVLNGIITGKGNDYNGQTQLTTIDLSQVTKTKTTEIPCHEITLTQLEEDGMAAWESRRVIVRNLEIVKAMGTPATRTATLSQDGTEFNVFEKIGSGCSGDKLSSSDAHVASITGYFVDNTYGGNTTTQLNITSADDITLAEKAEAQVVFNLAAGTGTNESPVAFTIGEDNTFPTAVVKDAEGNVIAGATVTYSTGNVAYISVDAETGVVTLKKYASKSNNVHVTATFAGNAEYKSATADYYLTIDKGTPAITFAEPNVSVALDGVANLAATVDAKYNGVQVKYTSSDPTVASFENENDAALTLNAEGTATITAQTIGNDAWKQSNKATYILTVTAPTAGYAYVTLNACGNDVEGYTEPLKVVKGRTVTLPVATTTKPEYTFKGWTSAGEVAKTATAPSLVETNYIANADVTLYPVFSIEESDGDDKYDVAWVAVESSEIKTSGYDVVIVSTGTKSRCIKTTAGNEYLVGADVTIEDGKITSTITDDSKWWAYESGSGVAFFAKNSYLNASTVSYSTEDQWTITPNGDKTYSMKSKISDTYLYLNGNAWATTSDASLSKMQFFMEKLIPVSGSTTYFVSYTLKVLELDDTSTSTDEVVDNFEKVIVKRPIRAGYWSPVCLPFAMSASQIAENFGDAEVKEFTGLTINGDNYSLKFSDATEMETGKAYMIRVSEAVNEIVVNNVEVLMGETAYDSDEQMAEDAEGNIVSITFQGNFYNNTTVPTGSYIINSNKFYFVNSTVTNKGFRGYFTVEDTSASSKARTLSFSFDDVLTDIEGVSVEGLNDNIFDLQGRRVQRLQQGVNIVNGRKVIR